MAKCGDNKTQFRGIELERTKPRTYIVDDDLGVTTGSGDGIAHDQAVTYQTITGKQLDNSTAWAGSPQAHDGAVGCTLGLPLSSSVMLTGIPVRADRDQQCEPSTIYPAAIAASSYKQRVIDRRPVFFPTDTSNMAGMVIIGVRADDNWPLLKPTVRLLNSTFVQQGEAATYHINRDDNGVYWYALHTATTGATLVPSVEIDCETWDTDRDIGVDYYGYDVLPWDWAYMASRVPSLPPDDVTGFAQPLRGTSFKGIWETFVAPGRPLSSIVTGQLAENDAFLHELVTGTPATGYGSAATSGHNHDGSLLGGPHIEMPLCSVGLGWSFVVNTGAAQAGGFLESEAINGHAPAVGQGDTDNSWYRMAHAMVQMPRRSAAMTMHWSAVVYDVDGNIAEVRPGYGTTLGSYTYGTAQQTTSGSGWKYVTGTCTPTHSELNYFIMQLRHPTGVGKSIDTNTALSLNGFNFWVE